MTPPQPPPQPATRSPLRRLTGDTLVYGIGGSAARLVSIVFVPIFTRIFSPADYGVLDLLTTLTSLMTLFAMLGANSAVFYFFRRSADHRERGRLVATAILMATAGATLIGVVGVLLSDRLAPVVAGDAGYRLAVLLTFVYLPINAAASMLLDLLRLEFRRVAYTVLGLARTLFSSALGVALAIGTHAGIAGLIGAQVALAAAAVVIGLWLTRNVWVPAFDLAAARRLLGFGLPLVPNGLSYWALQYVDRYFVLAYRGASELGIYAIANRLAALIMLLTYAFQTAWWPFAYAHAEQPDHRALFARVFRIVSVSLLAVTLLLGLFAREALMVLTTERFVPAYAYVGLLALALVIHSTYQIISIGVQLTGRTASLAWSSGAAAVVNLTLNFTLIPILGLWGASIATTVAYLTSTVLVYRVAQRDYPVPYDLRAPIVVALGGILLAAGGLLLDQLAPVGSWSPAITGVKVLAAVAAGALLLAYLRLPPGRLWRTARALVGWPRVAAG